MIDDPSFELFRLKQGNDIFLIVVGQFPDLRDLCLNAIRGKQLIPALAGNAPDAVDNLIFDLYFIGG